MILFCRLQKVPIFASRFEKNGMYWELSSAGSEHLPYKQRVTGSNPVAPTKAPQKCGAFLLHFVTSVELNVDDFTSVF